MLSDSDKIKLADEVLGIVEFGVDGIYCFDCKYIDTTGYCWLFHTDDLFWDEFKSKTERCQPCLDLIGGIE